MALIIGNAPVTVKNISIPYPCEDLTLPSWCTGLTGTSPGIWIDDDGTATYDQKLELSMDLIKRGIKSS